MNSTGVRFAKADAPVAVEFPAVILPPNVVVGLNALQVYSVSVTGQLPPGILYKWTLGGQPGTLAGQTTQTTTVPQVAFTAGNMPATGTLHVDVVTAAGVRWAKADGPVVVARAPSISFTLAGPWDPIRQPPNGTYNYPGGYDERFASGSGPGIDTILFSYNIGKIDGTIGVGLAVEVPSTRVIKTGDTFSLKPIGSSGLNNFVFIMTVNQTDPDDDQSGQYGATGTGTLRFDTVSRLADGTWVADYSFKITNSNGGTIVGVGAARWT